MLSNFLFVNHPVIRHIHLWSETEERPKTNHQYTYFNPHWTCFNTLSQQLSQIHLIPPPPSRATLSSYFSSSARVPTLHSRSIFSKIFLGLRVLLIYIAEPVSLFCHPWFHKNGLSGFSFVYFILHWLCSHFLHNIILNAL
jgi:hypothetical protein